MMKKLLFFTFFLFAVGKVFAGTGTLVLMNDSPYELTAIVYSADGTFLAQMIIQPGMQANWVERVSPVPLKIPNAPTTSQTPYTVVWRCSHGESFSICNDVSTGANVRATMCPGNHFCPSKQEGEEKPRCPACPPCPSCPSK